MIEPAPSLGGDGAPRTAPSSCCRTTTRVAQAWPLHSEEHQAGTGRAVLDLAARVVETVTRTAG